MPGESEWDLWRQIGSVSVVLANRSTTFKRRAKNLEGGGKKLDGHVNNTKQSNQLIVNKMRVSSVCRPEDESQLNFCIHFSCPPCVIYATILLDLKSLIVCSIVKIMCFNMYLI